MTRSPDFVITGSASSSTALFTDMYELTMIDAALREERTSGRPVALRAAAFEVFGRRLPQERRYGIVAGTGRLLEALKNFRFSEGELATLDGRYSPELIEWLSDYRFRGDIDGYREGELYFPGSPLLTVRGTFAECVVLETLILSILNHDSAVATAAGRMVSAAAGRSIIEMGSRRTHEEAAVASARATYLAGFTATSNLEAHRRYGIPVGGTSAHAWTLLHTTSDGPDEAAAFRAQIDSLGIDTTLLVDTYDISTGVRTAIDVAGPKLGGVRIDSGDLGVLARQVRHQLDDLGAHNTRVVVSGDLDEFAIAALRAEPVDVYGVGTSVVTGSGAPTAGMVYKLVEIDGLPVSKRSSHKETRGGAKQAVRTARATGTVVEEVVFPLGAEVPDCGGLSARELTVPLVRDGEVLPVPSLEKGRDLVASNLVSLPWEGLSLSRGEPVLPTRFVGFAPAAGAEGGR